jgi:cobalamin biosynthetic protein CobC
VSDERPRTEATLDPSIEAPRHGGALQAAARAYGIPLDAWLDLSTGINPLPYPLSPIPPEALTRLPDPDALAALTSAARVAFGANDATAVLAVPGTDLAMRLLPWLAPAGKVAILSPTYAGHGEAWTAAGRAVVEISTLDQGDAPILVVVNPNNPDGRVVPRETLLALGRERTRRGGLLVVDEAFVDLMPSASLVPAITDEAILVLRSFGKFYGLPGLRLGFVLGAPPLVERLARMIGDWPISGPALAAGAQALRDTDWQANARERLRQSRARLVAALAAAGLDASEGTDLFVLVRSTRAHDLHRALARQGIWTRIFAGDSRMLRIGLPADADFPRLEAALRTLGT